MKLWVAIRGVYSDATVVGVAASESEARDLVRAHYWNEYPEERDGRDPLDQWDTGSVDGPFELGQLMTDLD